MRETYIKSGAFDLKDEVVVPCVVCKAQEVYQGFVPGLKMKYITNTNCDECLKDTIEFAHTELKNLLKAKQPIPFFPDEKAIKENYENVAIIKSFKVKKL